MNCRLPPAACRLPPAACRLARSAHACPLLLSPILCAMAGSPTNCLVIVQISSRHVSCTVAWRQPGEPERVVAHKVVYCQWYELNERGRRQAVSEAVYEACQSASVRPYSVFVSISDARLQANFAVGSVDCGETVSFGPDEIELALVRATHQAIAVDREVLHVLPQRWEVRDSNGDRPSERPIGDTGQRLTCYVMLVTAPKRQRADLSVLLRDCDLELEAVIAPPVALYRGMYRMLAKSGCHLVFDCGAMHTSVVVHRKGRLVHIETHHFGGDHVTRLLIERFTLDPGRAEQLKQELDVSNHQRFAEELQGQTYLWRDVQERDRLLGPASHAARQLLLDFFRDIADSLGKRDLLAAKGRISVVGRASHLHGLTRLLQEVFSMPVTLGTGRKDRDPSAELVDLVTTGLIRTAAEERERLLRQRDVSGMHQARRLWYAMRNWLFAPLR
ncbi:MAG: cell division FtsA domain-containing protein [Planctomycetota bacterium]